MILLGSNTKFGKLYKTVRKLTKDFSKKGGKFHTHKYIHVLIVTLYHLPNFNHLCSNALKCKAFQLNNSSMHSISFTMTMTMNKIVRVCVCDLNFSLEFRLVIDGPKTFYVSTRVFKVECSFCHHHPFLTDIHTFTHIFSFAPIHIKNAQ